MIYHNIIKELESQSNTKKAEQLQRFFKTNKGDYGEGDKFLGITVPLTRTIAKEYIHTDYETIHRLLQSEYHEIRMCGTLILVEKFKTFKADAEKQELVSFYLDHTKCFNNWDLVDLSCYKILGAYLLNRSDRTLLYDLAKSGHLWSERIAIVSTYAFIRDNQFDDTLRIAKLFLGHTHDLMHKAVGWMLKEMGKRNRDVENNFLDEYAKQMPRTMLRIALEKHSYKEKVGYLSKK